jgi:hypothetical protein
MTTFAPSASSRLMLYNAALSLQPIEGSVIDRSVSGGLNFAADERLT